MSPRIVIVGSGISGLALGYFLRQRFGQQMALTILEKSSRPGGWLHTVDCQGFLFEKGPRSCRARGAGIATLQLCESLNLIDEVIAAAPAAQRRYLYIDQRLQCLPTNLLGLCGSPLTRGLGSAMWREWHAPVKKDGDESIAEFIGRRCGSEWAYRFFDPLTTGIYAGDIKCLSMSACFPRLYAWEQTYGSLLKGAWQNFWHKPPKKVLSPFVQRMQKTPLFALRRGMESLVQALQQRLGKDVHLSFEAIKICPRQQGGVQVFTSEGNALLADQVFLAVPAQVAAALLSSAPPTLTQQMSHFKTASVGVVNMGWKQKVLSHQGFGYLIPSKEKEDLLGVVWDSVVFPQQNRFGEETRLTAMLGGTHRPELLELSDSELIGLTLQSLRKHLGIVAEPAVIHVLRAHQAIPQYEVGHLARLHRLEADLADWSDARIKLLGSAWHGVSVNECIQEAQELARHSKCLDGLS